MFTMDIDTLLNDLGQSDHIFSLSHSLIQWWPIEITHKVKSRGERPSDLMVPDFYHTLLQNHKDASWEILSFDDLPVSFAALNQLTLWNLGISGRHHGKQNGRRTDANLPKTPEDYKGHHKCDERDGMSNIVDYLCHIVIVTVFLHKPKQMEKLISTQYQRIWYGRNSKARSRNGYYKGLKSLWTLKFYNGTP